MSSIQATDHDISRFLSVLETISAQQKTICAELDELTLLMLLPSESVLRVLQNILAPMGQDMERLTNELKNHLLEE
ncbi:hypothetical protein HF313_23025 [Massilia atriviolacea]|uniref:Uncharacterized protein n=1 Tax=Massilia atriviolacea TaxID=2495579 RepID=A0A430HCC4_9BURK|nr:hypothetical protein [Massilia atriviolacea]RSZ55164.1 hypothetical protein EJB06_30865 [Massilia atriviolacea]